MLGGGQLFICGDVAAAVCVWGGGEEEEGWEEEEGRREGTSIHLHLKPAGKLGG